MSNLNTPMPSVNDLLESCWVGLRDAWFEEVGPEHPDVNLNIHADTQTWMFCDNRTAEILVEAEAHPTLASALQHARELSREHGCEVYACSPYVHAIANAVYPA